LVDGERHFTWSEFRERVRRLASALQDIRIMHPDGYIELPDRAKDIIISGGENISTIEVEQGLVRPPTSSRRPSSPSRTISGASGRGRS
jgi:acyl-CoA synthetase (AMP-forming)/AMP-acid ligase II